MRIATWNINSIRLREPLLLKFIDEQSPDILCLQETKSPVSCIPRASFESRGFALVNARGEPSYNGVVILSRLPMEACPHRDFCARGDSRHVCARLESGLAIHNLYIPAGGDVPDPQANLKFGHKLDFVDELARWVASWDEGARANSLLLGDFNIAPFPNDVWSHRQLLNVVSHTAVEVERLERARVAGDWVDLARKFVPAEEKLYSWWSYRARDWRASNRGRRLDHIWASPALAKKALRYRILTEARGWDRPSDHVPVIVDFAP